MKTKSLLILFFALLLLGVSSLLSGCYTTACEIETSVELFCPRSPYCLSGSGAESFLAGSTVEFAIESSKDCQDEAYKEITLQIMDSVYFQALDISEVNSFHRSIDVLFPTGGTFDYTMTIYTGQQHVVDLVRGSIEIIGTANPIITWISPEENSLLESDTILLELDIETESVLEVCEITVRSPQGTLIYEFPGHSTPASSLQLREKIPIIPGEYGDYTIDVWISDSRNKRSNSQRIINVQGASEWTIASNPPYEFWEGVSFAVDGKAYFFGGQDLGGPHRTHIWEFDPATNLWTQKSAYPGGNRKGAFAFTVNGRGYVGGGQLVEAPFTYQDDFYRYETSIDEWIRLGDLPFVKVKATSFGLNASGYVGGGWSASNVPSSDFWQYNPASDQWESKPDIPGPARFGAVGVAMGAYGYLGLGNPSVSDWLRYDTENDSWSAMADYPAGPSNFCAGFVLGNTIYVGLGNSQTDHAKIFAYDPVANTWTPAADFPNTGPALSVVIGNAVWIKGGTFTENFFYKYLPD